MPGVGIYEAMGSGTSLAALERVVVAKRNDPNTYIATQVWPTIEVKKKEGKIYIWDADAFAPGATEMENEYRRAPNSKYQMNSASGTSTTTYACEDRGLEDVLDRDVIDSSEIPLLKKAKALQLLDKIMIEQEIRVAATMFSGSYITQNTTLSGTDQWSADATSNPVGVVQTGIRTLMNQLVPKNRIGLLLGDAVMDKLRFHSQLQAQIGASERKMITEEILAAIFGIGKVIVGTSQKKSDDKLAAGTATFTETWGKHACLFMLPQNVIGLQGERATGYLLMYKQMMTKTWDIDMPQQVPGWWVRVNYDSDDMLVDATSAYLIINAVA